jgi:hypothetical protein
MIINSEIHRGTRSKLWVKFFNSPFLTVLEARVPETSETCIYGQDIGTKMIS